MLKRHIGTLLKYSIKVNASFFHIGFKVFYFSCKSDIRVNCKCFCYFGADLPHHLERCVEISYIPHMTLLIKNSVIIGLHIGILLDVSVSVSS